MADLFQYVPHPRIAEHKAAAPTKVADVRRLDHPNPMVRFNARLGLDITNAVGTMWAAYLFAMISLLSLPYILYTVNRHVFSFFPSWLLTASLLSLVSWVSSYFLQLVLLPIIIVGQNLQARASDKRAQDTFQDAEAVLHEATQIQAHLAAQDQVISEILQRIERVAPG